MTSVYNKLYDNDAYNRMARAIADHMGIDYDKPTKEYLDAMVLITDYSLLKLDNIPLYIARVCYHESIWPYYIDFIENCAQHYRGKQSQ